MKKICFLFSFLFFSFSALATDIPKDIAVLRGLDKVTGRISTFSIPVGGSGQFGNIFIDVEGCFSHPPEESPEHSVFLHIYGENQHGVSENLFQGWMFFSNPALSAMEHPVYDVWVLECLEDKNKKDVVPPLKVVEATSETPSVAEPIKNQTEVFSGIEFGQATISDL